MKTLTFSIFFLSYFINTTYVQDIIYLDNPSFETNKLTTRNMPLCCSSVEGWKRCINLKNVVNTPDSQPGNFGVSLSAVDGNYYLALVSRDNNTNEFIGQKLDEPLLKGNKYWFSIALASSRELLSISRTTKELVHFNDPVSLMIWGTNKNCKNIELLAESPVIKNEKWEYFEFYFEPKENVKFIKFEVKEGESLNFIKNGNILLDDCSAIINLDLKEEIELEKSKRALGMEETNEKKH